MRAYKLVLLLKSDIKKEQKEKFFDDVKKWVGKAEKEKVESLGEKRLAYPIKHERKGEYVLVSFEADRVDEDFDKKLRINEYVIRHLLVRS